MLGSEAPFPPQWLVDDPQSAVHLRHWNRLPNQTADQSQISAHGEVIGVLLIMFGGEEGFPRPKNDLSKTPPPHRWWSDA